MEVEGNGENPQKPKITGKITDFGLSSILGTSLSEKNSQISGAYRWAAPELYLLRHTSKEDREKHLEKADVWSFAMTCLEVSLKSSLSKSCFSCYE